MKTCQGFNIACAIFFILSVSVQAEAQPVRPPHLTAQLHRAEVAWKSGSGMLEAKARVDRVLEEVPDDGEARLLRAKVLLALGRPAEALDDATRAVALNPENAEAYLAVCEAARLSGNISVAEQAVEEVGKKVIQDAALHMLLSREAAELGLLERAESFARISVAQDPGRAAAHYQLARIFVLRGKTADAVTTLARGLKSSLLDPEAVRNDSLLARVSGDPALRDLIPE